MNVFLNQHKNPFWRQYDKVRPTADYLCCENEYGTLVPYVGFRSTGYTVGLPSGSLPYRFSD